MVLITPREMKIINKKINGLSLSQNESNILSKSIRKKLNEVRKIDSEMLLKKLEYNQEAKSIENKIKKQLLKNLGTNIHSIIVYGSAIQNNYKNYNDVDVLIITKSKTWNSEGEKYDMIMKLANDAKRKGINLDTQILNLKSFIKEYHRSPSLIYQLKDCKIIYGKIAIPKKTELSKLDLRMKLDWSDIDDESSKAAEIYQSLRNAMLVKLLLNKIVNNDYLNKMLIKELGEKIILRLKNNTASRLEKKLALKYTKDLVDKTDKEILEAPWEKIVL